MTKEAGARSPSLLALAPLKFKPKRHKLEIEFELNKAFAMSLHS